MHATEPDRADNVLDLCGELVPVSLVRNRRARHYILRVTRGGGVRITVPAFGSKREAFAFAREHREWLEDELRERNQRATEGTTWRSGTDILFRGRTCTIKEEPDLFGMIIHFSDQRIVVDPTTGDLRPAVTRHLRALAQRELVPRTRELADRHRQAAGRVAVRNQRTLWGSCSPDRNISLNWRLVHAPRWVSDYVILHELIHVTEFNHSPRFWKLVRAACPRYKAAERWLKKHDYLLEEK